MHLLNKLLEYGKVAKVWVYLKVVVSIVLVVGEGMKNGVEIDSSDAEVLEIVEFGDNSTQVAAHVILWGGGCPPRLDIFWVIGWVAITEAFGEYLIKDSVFYPFGCGKRVHEVLVS
jgi:hypothetical protein